MVKIHIKLLTAIYLLQCRLNLKLITSTLDQRPTFSD